MVHPLIDAIAAHVEAIEADGGRGFVGSFAFGPGVSLDVVLSSALLAWDAANGCEVSQVRCITGHRLGLAAA